MSARGFTHPNFGKEARVEVWGKEVRLIFIANTEAQANSMADTLIDQIKAGGVHLTMMGKPTAIVES